VPGRHAFDYASIRIVPRVERGEFINAGVVLFCRTRRFLDARVELAHARLVALAPSVDVGAISEQLSHIPLVSAGGAAAGPIGLLPQQERFRWLAAPRSTIVQPSPVHCGVCVDPAVALEHIMAQMVQLG
jgi:hypothetical protein